MRPGTRLAVLALALAAALVLAGCGARSAGKAGAAKDRPGSTRGGETSAGATASADPTPFPVAAKSTVPATLVFHGDESAKRVALTFDLCEVPTKPSGYDQKLVDVLVSEHASATFMMGGHWAETHPQDAKFLGNVAFFEIGNHSYAHRHPTGIGLDAFRREIERGQTAVTDATGRTPSVFRFPYGEHDTTTVAQVAAEGLVPVQWSVETGDPDRNVSAAAILRVVKQKTTNGSIIIMHANGRGWHTAEALPKVIEWLRAEGYELVTVSELLGKTAP